MEAYDRDVRGISRARRAGLGQSDGEAEMKLMVEYQDERGEVQLRYLPAAEVPELLAALCCEAMVRTLDGRVIGGVEDFWGHGWRWWLDPYYMRKGRG